MDIICAWCGKKIGKKDSKGVEGKTHGLCKDCQETYFPYPANSLTMEKYLEQQREFQRTK